MKETPVDLVRVAPTVAEPGLLPLGYPNPTPLHAVPTAPHPDNPQVFLHGALPQCHGLTLECLCFAVILASCRNLTVRHVRRNTGICFFNRWIFGKLWKPFHWKRRKKKVVPLATGLSSCKFQRPAVNNSVRASKLQGYFIVESVRQPK